MIDLLCLFRALNLHTHHMHNTVKGDEFFQDHAFFSDLYAKADDYYDQIIERMIGTGLSVPSLLGIMMMSQKCLIGIGLDPMESSLKLVEKCIKSIETLAKDDKLSIGTQNLIAGQADALEDVVYKLKGRMEDES